MNLTEAKEVLFKESMEGVAYTSRFGEYPDRSQGLKIIEALRVIYKELKGEEVIDRQLAASLFVINDQVQGNMAAAEANGVKTPEEFSENIFPEINELFCAIFEDWDEE